MSTLILILPDHCTTWSQHVPGVPTFALARRVRRGEFRLPEAWQQCLEQRYPQPADLDLELRVHSNCVVLVGHLPGTPGSEKSVLRLSRHSGRVMRQRLAGATFKEIRYRRRQRRAWAEQLIQKIMRRAGRKARERGV